MRFANPVFVFEKNKILQIMRLQNTHKLPLYYLTEIISKNIGGIINV